MIHMRYNEPRNLLVQAVEKNHTASQTTQDFGVSRRTVYCLEQQMKQLGA